MLPKPEAQQLHHGFCANGNRCLNMGVTEIGGDDDQDILLRQRIDDNLRRLWDLAAHGNTTK